MLDKKEMVEKNVNKTLNLMRERNENVSDISTELSDGIGSQMIHLTTELVRLKRETEKLKKESHKNNMIINSL